MSIYNKQHYNTLNTKLSRINSPRLFLPMAILLLPSVFLAIISFGISLIFTSFVWVMLDIEICNYLKTGYSSVKRYYSNNISFGKIFMTSMLRRIIVLLGYLCFILPGIYLSSGLSNLGCVIIDNPTINNPFKLIHKTFEHDSTFHKSNIYLAFSQFYIFVLIVLTFGIISPWAIPYIRQVKVMRYLVSNDIPLSPSIVTLGSCEYLPPMTLGDLTLPDDNSL